MERVLGSKKGLTMFEAGKSYDVTILEPGDDTLVPMKYPNLIFVENEATMAKFSSPAGQFTIGDNVTEIPEREYIFNTSGLYFVSAVPAGQK